MEISNYQIYRKAQKRYLFGITVTWRIKEASVDDIGTGRGDSEGKIYTVYEIMEL